MSPTLLYPPKDLYYDFNHHNTNYDFTAFKYPRHSQHSQYAQYSQSAPIQQIPYASTQPFYYSSPTMTEQSPQDMEDMQRLSYNWRADLPGPLIGDKLPMNVLTSEYAQADPLYVVKIVMLERNYSSYRAIKGDGQCGWRGTVFAYFEMLLQCADLDLVQQEKVRLQTFEDAIRLAGIDFDILSDMFEFTWEVFEAMEKAIEQNDRSEATILQFLNNDIASNSIVYHFKIMTAAYMQLHADQYEPFLDMSVAEYRAMRIEASDREIDQISLQGLTDAIIQPADFGLEVLYLDRSNGQEATLHPFVPDHVGKHTIRLLYRPGHYDVIYKKAIQPAPKPAPVPVCVPVPTQQIYLQHSSFFPQAESQSQPGPLMAGWMLPFFYSPEPNVWPGNSNIDIQQTDNHLFSPYPQPPAFAPQMPHEPINNIPTPASFGSSSFSSTSFDFQPSYSLGYPSPDSTDMSSPTHTTTPILPPHALPSALQTSKLPKEPQIRLSANCYGYSRKHESVPLCNQAYGSPATLSTAHFRNQDFQPHMWTPEEDYMKSP